MMATATPSSPFLPWTRPLFTPSPLPAALFLPGHLRISHLFTSTKQPPPPDAFCRAAKQQQQQKTGPVKKRGGKKRAPEKLAPGDAAAAELLSPPGPPPGRSHSSPLPKPPAGFVLDPHGEVLMVSNKRIATIANLLQLDITSISLSEEGGRVTEDSGPERKGRVKANNYQYAIKIDASNNLPLECVIRRVFQSSRGDECMLLCPVDTPVQILKRTNFNGWSAVNDEEVDSILPAATYALAKIHMHLVISGFCYTARGGFCYSEQDILEFRTDDGEDIDGLPTEGVEITCFHMDGAQYMIYTPSDPLLFVAVKDNNGGLLIADDDLLEDPSIIGAIDEETEFNALVEEEATLLESLMGEQ